MTAQSVTTTALPSAVRESAHDSGINAAGRKAGRSEVKKVAEEFQSLFIEMILKSMRDTIGKESLTGGGRGEEIYGALLDREYAMAISRRGNIGLAEMMERQILMQEDGGAARATKEKPAVNTDRGKIEAYHEDR